MLEKLYERPIISVAQIREVTGTSYQAANDRAGRLVQLGILVEFTGHKRHRRFRYDGYVRLFDE